MKTLSTTLILATTLFSFSPDATPFSGKIHYKFTFANLKGEDITEEYAAYTGKEEVFVINANNYKAMNEKGNLTRLYNSKDNLYYTVNSDKTAEKTDATTKTSQKYTCTKLTETTEIAGYTCNELKVETEFTTTVYYYSSKVKVDPAPFEKHNFMEFNKYLQATNGALFLKFVMTDTKNNYVWTVTAMDVTNQPLKDEEFVLPSEIKLLN